MLLSPAPKVVGSRVTAPVKYLNTMEDQRELFAEKLDIFLSYKAKLLEENNHEPFSLTTERMDSVLEEYMDIVGHRLCSTRGVDEQVIYCRIRCVSYCHISVICLTLEVALRVADFHRLMWSSWKIISTYIGDNTDVAEYADKTTEAKYPRGDTPGRRFEHHGILAHSNYHRAYRDAIRYLPLADPVRLDAFYSLAVFMDHVHGDREESCRIMREALGSIKGAPLPLPIELREDLERMRVKLESLESSIPLHQASQPNGERIPQKAYVGRFDFIVSVGTGRVEFPLQDGLYLPVSAALAKGFHKQTCTCKTELPGIGPKSFVIRFEVSRTTTTGDMLMFISGTVAWIQIYGLHGE